MHGGADVGQPLRISRVSSVCQLLSHLFARLTHDYLNTVELIQCLYHATRMLKKRVDDFAISCSFEYKYRLRSGRHPVSSDN